MIMKVKEEDKGIDYWKANAEEDYMTTPISVLRYITELESKVNNVALDDCIEIFNRYLLKKLSKVEEYATFCIECDRRGLPLITFNDWLERVEHHKN